MAEELSPEEMDELRECLPILRAIKRLISKPPVDRPRRIKVGPIKAEPFDAEAFVERARRRKGLK